MTINLKKVMGKQVKFTHIAKQAISNSETSFELFPKTTSLNTLQLKI